MKHSRTLQEMSVKELETVRGQIDADLNRIGQERRAKSAKRQAIEEELKARKSKPDVQPAVSDHALLRYMERVMGFDVEGLRAKILTPSLVSAVNSGVRQYSADGITMLVRDKTIVTITGDAA